MMPEGPVASVASRSKGPSASVIVPFHRHLDDLERCLSALALRPPAVELIVASDGAVDECETLAGRYGARVVHLARRSGPAAARNRAAALAMGEILVFVDTDVVVAAGALEAMLSRFADDAQIAAVFGSYDDNPDAEGFFSQYKNLTHAFVHRTAAGDVPSFWAGFGGIRASVFRSLGGFDESYTRPCIEDIELGSRLAAAGYRAVIDPRLQACHLKRWTFTSMVTSDVRDRGIPWTRLILQTRQMPTTLNVDRSSRASVALCWAALICTVLSPIEWRLLAAAAVALIAALWMNRALYGFLAARRGVMFAALGSAVHVLYHLYNGVSFVVGAAMHLWTHRGRRAGASTGQRGTVEAVCSEVTSDHATPGRP